MKKISKILKIHTIFVLAWLFVPTGIEDKRNVLFEELLMSAWLELGWLLGMVDSSGRSISRNSAFEAQVIFWLAMIALEHF